MPNLPENPRLLVVHCDHPNSSMRAFGDANAFAHPRAFGAYGRRASVYSYGDMNRGPYATGNAAPFPLDRFALDGQLDEKNAQPYAVRYGWQPEHGAAIVTARELANMAKPIAALDRAMTKLDDMHGAPATHGALVVRLAQALKVDRLVLLHPRPWHDDSSVHMSYCPAEFGKAVWYVDQQCRKAHDACRKLCGMDEPA